MKFYADSYFTIGNAHITAGKPCQDYAVTGVAGDGVCAVVSDGCSTGGRTDVGARVVAHATVEAIRLLPAAEPANQRYIISSGRDLLGLDKSDMLATCISVHAKPFRGTIKVQGDGVAAIKFEDGLIRMHRFDWNNNTPFYPAYVANGNEGAFFAAHGGEDAFALEEERIYRDGEIETEIWQAGTGARGVVIGLPLERIQFAAVFSDGVTQIDGVDWKDAVRELLNFKNFNGEFVKRRAIRFLKECRERGKGPIDDFSMAVIRVEHD